MAVERPLLAAAVRALLVVLHGVLVEYVPEVASAEDQHLVGELGAGAGTNLSAWAFAHEASGRDLEDFDACVSAYGVERCGWRGRTPAGGRRSQFGSAARDW